MTESFYRVYLSKTHREVFDTPEKVLQELYNIVADYQNIQKRMATVFADESPEYKAKLTELEFLISRWWLSLNILGLHTPLRFVKECLHQLLNDKVIQNLAEWQQLLLVAVLLLKFFEDHPEELLDPRKEPWFDHQQELLIILMNSLIEKQVIPEILFRGIQFEASYTPQQRQMVISVVLQMIERIPILNKTESSREH